MPDRVYPSTRYHPEHPPKHVFDETEHEDAEASGWYMTPADFPDDATDDATNDDVNREAATPAKPKRKR
ncbi:hypothetical protein [Nevskia soli]|uniref:hypothetical protein n=1 Tax=Nevskia soli TaxID=418856 RepID=UPI0015D84AC5|nr:hypothetical protein [Nevskia soli]